MKKQIKKIIQKALHLFPTDDLYLLALKHGTDKRGHGYTGVYKEVFSKLKNQQLNILEIGVGGFDNPNIGGASLRMWKEYFKRSNIFSIDVYDKSQIEEKRIKIFKGSQNDVSFLERVANEIGTIDIIIDDGSHICEHIITSFNTLFSYLNSGGVYIIEDSHTSYLPQFGGDYTNFNNNSSTVGFFKELVDGLNYEYIPNRKHTVYDGEIISILFYPKMIIVHKGKNKHRLTPYNINEINKAENNPDCPIKD
ncbi:MAG: class I SAM-dependent methyltransferase [Bacteroidetes bacterium]|nr:class I SAM-dependent methyltransferase [Bacteroidota bacterium]